jgi:hypothetical protein
MGAREPEMVGGVLVLHWFDFHTILKVIRAGVPDPFPCGFSPAAENGS